MRHSSLAEYWKSKYEGQESRCKDLVRRISALEERIVNQRREIAELNSYWASQKDLNRKLKEKLDGTE